MREISFRGKRVEDGKWVYGYIILDSIVSPVLVIGGENDGEIRFERHAVSRHTVGEYTGLQDKDSNQIFEGDIVKCRGRRWVIVHNEANTGFAGRLVCDKGVSDWLASMDSAKVDTYEVIGNIHDNSELLEVHK